MKRVIKSSFIWLLVSCLILVSMPMQVEAALTTAPMVNETYVKNRIAELAKKLSINNGTLDTGDGVYFTVNQKPCGYGISGHSCDNCLNSAVVNTTWFRNIFGTVPSEGFPRQYGSDGAKGSNIGWSCWGFATFAMWYVTSTNNTNNINSVLVTQTTFSKANIQKYLAPGDIIRCSVHSMLFISAGENSIKVMDCNGLNASGNCRVRIREIPYSGFAGLAMGVTRAENYDVSTISQSYNPQGMFDTVTSEEGTITVSGWAFDRDDLNAQLDIHVYVGGPSLSGAPCYVIKADKKRTDVSATYPGVGDYHGFYEIIEVSARGETDVYVYAINNVKDQDNPLLGKKTINIVGDTPAAKPLPTLTGNKRVDAANIAKSQIGYTEVGDDQNIYGKDLGQNGYAWGALFPIWCVYKAGVEDRPTSRSTTANVTWFQEKGVWHNKQSTPWSYNGNSGDGVVDSAYVPQVGDFATIESSNPSDGPENCGIITTIDSNWIYVAVGNISNSVVEQKYSKTNLLKDGSDSATYISGFGSIKYDTKAPVISNVKVTDITAKGFTITCDVTDDAGIDKVCFPTWTDANGQDDLQADWVNTAKATSVSGKTYSYRVNVADHKSESGLYITHIYAYDTSGNQKVYKYEYDMPEAVTSIALDKTTLKLTIGSTGQLTATVSPSDAGNKKLTWKSSNTSVATVDSNGKVTAVGTGTATITVTAADGSGVKVTCTVTVEPKKVSSITLSKATLDLTTGATSQLTATVSPSDAGNKKVNWKSSNTSVATIDSTGKVTAVGAGKATITATAADGSGVKATCTVTVVSNLSITAQPANISITEGANATFKVAATGSDLTYQWQFKNASANYWTNSGMTGSNTNSITVKATTARNGYQYRCVVKDGSGNKVTSNAAKLTVNKGAQITGQPSSATVSEGAGATFKVTASGSGLTYQWQFKKVGTTYWTNSTMTGSKTNSITVQGTAARNGYQYRCVVKDANGNKVTSNAATLTVVQGQGVKITGQPGGQIVTEGSNATFKVTATGSNLTYQWQFKKAGTTYWSDSTMAGSKTNSITVQGTTARNGYQYRCVVKDGNGNKVTSNAATLTVVQGQGVKITSQPVSQTVTAGSSATFKVTASGSGLTYQWQFKSTANNYWADSTMAGSKTNSITVQGTTARNGYQYRCVVKDSNGNKVTSNAAKLTVQ